ncbi:MAG TPA: prepilin-type N-terminal cleavage/methylation domain-containing protein, partial [Burkholderiales bacterium]|nr:prepilin-type N-terminal cleavage/methylation domain-containing protein [Burkholderiales bacterium]
AWTVQGRLAMKSRQQGFTLVEIAIVLVIIGLLLGGILKGQEMITQAKIKNVIADFSGVSAAYHGYQDRYRAIPGDDPNAAGRWTTAPAAISGSGNGVVGGTYNNTCPAVSVSGTPESCMWWDHLRRAGFVSGNGAQQPFNAVTGQIGVQTGDNTSGAVLGASGGAGGFSGLIICSANLPDKIAIAVDTQMDDGQRLSGSVRGQLQAAPNPAILQDATSAPAGASANYAETGTNTYVLCRAF